MAQVTVNVNGRDYELGCADGEEDQLRALAADLDQRMRDLTGQVGQVGDNRLLMMLGLLLLDELKDAASAARVDDASGFDVLASRIEALADRLDHP